MTYHENRIASSWWRDLQANGPRVPFCFGDERMAKPRSGRRLVQFEATEELVARADAAARREMLNRSSWLRRLVDSATKGLPSS